jgi:caffeoyl-CoA O-methyltransferase
MPAVELVDPRIEAYAEAHTTPPTPLLKRLAEETRETLRSPGMLTGAIEGRFLELLVHGLGARRVLEIGTYSGYSALSMAAGLPPDGRIDTCEVSEEHAAVARRYVEEAGESERITVHLGPALETLERLDGPWDFVFVDADKSNYRAYVDAVLPRLAGRGLIAIDNTLWSGRVLEPEEGDDDTRAIAELNDALARDMSLVCAQLPVRDGVTLVRRAI